MKSQTSHSKYTSVFYRFVFLAALSLMLSACLLDISAGVGGSVYRGLAVEPCADSCFVDTTEANTEVFHAVADSGFVFSHWEGATESCAEAQGSICTVTRFGPLGHEVFDNFGLDLTAIFQQVEATETGNAVSISAGAYDMCTVLNTNEVQCWGRNYGGQLNDGSAGDSAQGFIIGGISSAIAVSVNDRESCALLDTGEVRCWGWKHNGHTDRPTPVTLSGIKGYATAVTTGSNHSCVLLDIGEVQCWGYNIDGQLGDGGTTLDSASPLSVIGLRPSPWLRVVRITASYSIRAWYSAGGITMLVS